MDGDGEPQTPARSSSKGGAASGGVSGPDDATPSAEPHASHAIGDGSRRSVFDFESSICGADSLPMDNSTLMKKKRTLLKKTVLFEDDDDFIDETSLKGSAPAGSLSGDKLDALLNTLRDSSDNGGLIAANGASDDNNITIRSASDDGSRNSFSKNKRYSANFSIRKTSVEDFISSTRKDALSSSSAPHNSIDSGSGSEYATFLASKEADKRNKRHSLFLGTINRVKVEEGADPLSDLPTTLDDAAATPLKLESLTIRVADEARIVSAMVSAARKQTTGSVFSVRVDISGNGALGIGVKDLGDAGSLLSVSMLKRADGKAGASELAGVRLGDVIFGINFQPTREGSKTLLQVLRREAQRQRRIVHLQCWRCHQLCSDAIPGSLFPRADDAIVQAHALFKSKVFNDWERWNFIEILLGHIVDDLKSRALGDGPNPSPSSAGFDDSYSLEGSSGRYKLHRLDIARTPSVAGSGSTEEQERRRGEQAQKRQRAKQMRILDLERNILQAKSLRNAICVRIVHTKTVGETIVYVLRVEDVESGLQWVAHKRYRDFNALNDELNAMSGFAKDVLFPKKVFPSIRNTSKLVEQRIVLLEQYVRRVLHLLTLYATMDLAASRSLRHLQDFLAVDKYIDCVHPPFVDDQRYLELIAYRFLNDFSSPACQQCVRFATTVDLDSLVTAGSTGYAPVLGHLSQALAEVEQFVLQQCGQQLLQALKDRKADLDEEQAATFARRCVRRQVEAALFLPLRRNAFRITYSFIAEQTHQMQSSLELLLRAPPEYFMVDPLVEHAKSLPRAVQAFKDFVLAYLPTDQCQLLLHASAAIMELHTECQQTRSSDSFLDSFESSINIGGGGSLSTGLGHETDSLGRASGDSVRSSSSTLPRSLTNSEFADSAAHVRLSAAARDISSLIRRDSSVGGSVKKSVATVARPVSVAIVDGANKAMTMNSFRPNSSDGDSVRANINSKNSSSKISLNLMDIKTLSDPVGEMFHAYETCTPGRAVDGALPTDRYSQISDFDNLLDRVASTGDSRDDSFQRDYNDVVRSSGGGSRRASLAEATPDAPRALATAPTDDTYAVSVRTPVDNVESSKVGIFEGSIGHSVVSADDFLPMFTYVLVQAGLPQILLVKEMMTSLVGVEESYGEVGYYVATLEAATQHVVDLAAEFRTQQMLWAK